MVGFVFVGFALFTGDLLPWTVRVLMLGGGLTALASPFAARPRPDPGANYPYPAQDDVLGGDTD